MMNSVLVFSIATNGYNYYYRSCIQTHREYTVRYGYDYVLVTRPYVIWNHSFSDSAWMKIPLLLAAMKKGYEWILFLDADCYVKPSCPEVQSVERPDKYIYAANGYSGRPNSGVMIVKNTAAAKDFYNNILLHSDDLEIPAEDQAPYENGHFIYFSKRCGYFHTLDSIWNNNADINKADYIRHYTGRLGKFYRPRIFQKLFFSLIQTLIKYRMKFYRLASKEDKSMSNNRERLLKLCSISCSTYPRYFSS